MSETKSLAAAKTKMDRRAVIKGVAWTVPVISVAIAAPAAAASPRPTGTVTLQLGDSVGMVYSGVTPRAGTAPILFTIVNGTAAGISGTASFTITITRPNKGTGIFVKTFGTTAVSMGAYNAQDVATVTFSRAYTVPAGGTQTFAIAYSQDAPGSSAKAGTYRMDVIYSISSPVMSSPTPTPTRTLTVSAAA